MIKIRSAVPEDAEYGAMIIDLAGTQQFELPSFKGEQKVPLWATSWPVPKEERLERLGWLFMNAVKVSTHYSKFKVAEIDGRIAGGLCTHTREHDRLNAWLRAWRKMGFSYMEIIAGYMKWMPFYRTHLPILENTLVVEFVATFPEFQRRGVITALLEDAIEKAKSEGYPRMQVTTWIGNLASKKAYEKVGFRIDKEKTHKSFEELYGSPGQVRLILEF
ncbi:MAG: GNAT family N-acetyltransferase [Actinobacteria bacterium]|nr:GNAT family N-acetyltransferase [Actinomycetota bacterium]